MNSEPRLRLRLKPAAEKQVRGGHPWVFANSVRESNRAGRSGELAVIYDRANRFLAVGLHDPDSPIRVRVLHAGEPEAITPVWWEKRLAEAVGRRAGLFDARTTGYRVLHGENDGWPGLVLDRYADTLVLKVYSAAWFPWLPQLLPLFNEQIPNERIVPRFSRNIPSPAAREHQLADGQIISGAPLAGPVIFIESGLRFEADVLRGQKTGFFLDQRENRRLVGTLSRGGHVLNAFSFSGGFSLYAARGGAVSTTDLDISPHALAAANRNFARNADQPGVADCRHRTIQADAVDWLETAPRKEQQFDLIVLDPPSFAKKASEGPGALRAYGRLARNAIQHLRPRGILAACSCSAHVAPSDFFRTIREAARSSRRPFEELQTTGQPPDHAARFPEFDYLKCIYLRFSRPPLQGARRGRGVTNLSNV